MSGSSGLPISSTEAQIFDDDGKELAPGEICIRGRQVMESYWPITEEAAKVMLPGGWFHTGHIGRMDDNGFFYIEDRK